jgi:hypothetical protein
MLVNRRNWKQQHGTFPELADIHVNSHVYYA